MKNDITYKNKDVLFKVLDQNYKNKSLSAYGLDIPRIKRMLPSNYPSVSATEIYADNPFLLEDDSLYLQEYESTVESEDGLKYTRYICSAVEQLRKEGIKVKNVIIGVIYTGDIISAPDVYDLGALRVQFKQVFLSRFDSNALYADLKSKIESGATLSDEDLLRLIVLPLTQPDKNRKQRLTEDSVALAKQIKDEQQQVFSIAGILVATNKFIDCEYSNQIKEWIRMTKVARLFEEEKIEAVIKARKEAREEAQEKVKLEIALNMLQIGDDYLKVMQCTGVTREEIDRLQKSLAVGA